ncbi:MAG: hypothetical protein AMS16_04325 [Planctomycetes bacterium DG_58]|nr:MAG: hypothetical protein AMS16_04325 [Planctomycetes bacterium DG_58]
MLKGQGGLRWLGVVGVLLWSSLVHAQYGRIGLAEEFDTMTGWEVTRGKLAGMYSENGRGVFETHIQNLPAEVNGRKVTADTFLEIWKPGQPAPRYSAENFGGKAGALKELGVVDLDRYHYLVVKIDWRPLGAELELKLEDPATGRGRNWPVQVMHSSGNIAQDLKPFGIRGKQKVSLYLEVFPTGRMLKVDYIRLVSELLKEEQAGLIPAPITLPAENLERHPYQKLEALWQRAPRPWTDLPESAEEQALFRDVGTKVPTWRMTGTPAHEGLKGADKPHVWRDDGSSMSTPARTWHFARHAWGPERGSHWTRLKTAAREDFTIYRDKSGRKWVFSRKLDDGKTEVIYEHPWPNRPTYRAEAGVFGNRLVAAMVGSEVVVVDVPKDGGKPRVKAWPLPDIGAKGFWMNEKTISYWAPFLSLHRIMVDLDTGKITKGVHPTMTHGMSGEEYSIMSYDGVSKVVVSRKAKMSDTPGKELSIYGIYKTLISTDYGEMSSDYRYGITNGLIGRGELGGQYVLFDRLDAGTVLRLCTYNVSYETWDLRAKVSASPDYTKLAYGSDMLGDADYYMTIMRLPSRPTNLKLAGGTLTWDAPVPCAEVHHYNVYRSQESGGPYECIASVKETTFTDRERPASACYLVTAEEHSGLESCFSDEVRGGEVNTPLTLHFEAENLQKKVPWRDVVDGTASGFRAVRVTPVRETETRGRIETNAVTQGRYKLWVRAKHWEDGSGVLLYAGNRHTLGYPPIKVASKKWQWLEGKLQMGLSGGESVTLSSADSGVAIDKVVLTSDPDYRPQTADDRLPTPQAVAGLEVAKTDANSVELKWDASPEKNVAFYSVYVSEKADFVPGNETLLCSTHKTSALDWGIQPDTTYTYKVVAVNKRWMDSPPAAISAKTKPLDVVTRELAATAATATDGMQKTRDYVEYPGKEAGEQSLMFEFDVPADGTYYVWMKYTPSFNQRWAWDSIGVSWDDGKPEDYRTRPRLARGQKKPGRWFIDRLDQGKLAAGKHVLKLVFAKKDDIRTGMGQRIARVWVTNDASFVPPGYTAQVMFEKPTPWNRE